MSSARYVRRGEGGAAYHGIFALTPILQALAPYSSQILGVDTSQQMVASYNAKFRDQGIPSEKIRAVVGDLTSEAASSDPVLGDGSNGDVWNFDLVVIGVSYLHHT